MFKTLIKIIAIMTTVVGFSFFTIISGTGAANLISMSDNLSTLAASTSANHTILFTTPTGVAAGETVVFNFPTGFTIAAALDYEDLDLSYEAAGGDGVCDTGDTELTLAAAASGATWGAVRTDADTVTFTSGTGTIPAGAEVCIEVGTDAEEGASGVEQVVNSTAGNSKVASISVGSSDSGQLAIAIVSDDSVSVTATVDPTFEFAISDVTIGFGNLTSGNARYATGNGSASDSDTAAHNITVATNAASGYAITYNGATLTDGANTISVATITDDADGTAGTEEFAFCASDSGGSNATVSAGYDCDDGPDWNFVADTTTTFATGSSATTTVTYAMHYLANISDLTEAGSYSTSVTYIGTGTF